MIWKEMYSEAGTKLNWAAWIAVGILILITFGSGLFVVGAVAWDSLSRGVPLFSADYWHQLPEAMNAWFRIAGTAVSCLLLLRIAVYASTTITSERERETFDALLTTPLTSEAMLNAKLLGCLTSVRIGWIWLGSMVVLAVITGGVHPLAVPILVVAWMVYATFFAMIGIWYSMICKSSMRATIASVLTSIFVGGGHWLVAGLCCYFPAAIAFRNSNPGDWPEYVVKFQAGMTPPFVIGFCAFSWENLARDFHTRDVEGLMPCCFLGIFLWAGACAALWNGLLLPRFRQVSRRVPLIRESNSA